jgi:hypothetical protein
MLFNEANIDSRLRYLVRGRVIVFTTSKVVEFIEDHLKFSYPLYSVDSPYPAGMGLSFMVEVNGYLSFDKDSFVKITPEMSPFTALYYDPTAFAIVRAGDPYKAHIDYVEAQGGNPGLGFTEDGRYKENRVFVTVKVNPTTQEPHYFIYKEAIGSYELTDLARQVFVNGSSYLGDDAYPGFTAVADFSR